MGMTAAAVNVNSKMIHVTWNANGISIEMWEGSGLGNLQSITFTQPLVNDTLYKIEFEVDAANDTVTLYGPGGEVLVYTDAMVSEAASANIFYEFIGSTTALKLMDFHSVWATDNSSSRASFEGRIAESKASAANSPSIKSLAGMTGNITSTGVLSMASDTDSTHTIGRSKIGFIITDNAAFGHTDHMTTQYKNAITQDGFGQTVVGSSGASFGVSVAPNGALNYLFLPTRLEIRSGVTEGIMFEGATNDVHENFLKVVDPTADRTVLLPDASGTVAVWTTVPANASATGIAGQMAYESGFLYVCVAANTWQRVPIASW
jgi:hypothetical protein